MEIVRLRQLLEVPPMREIARTLQPQTAAELRVRAEHIVETAAAADIPAYLAADNEFHLNLLQLVGNRRLVDLVRDLRQQTRMVGLVGMIGTVELARSAAEHHQLMDLLEQRDGRGPSPCCTPTSSTSWAGGTGATSSQCHCSSSGVGCRPR